MITLPPQLRLGLRIGLAIVLAFAVALSQDWDRPQWAGIAVMSVSMDSEAASLTRGGMRLAATGAAAVVALTLIALFSQERWGFFLGLSVHLAVCGYHMLNSRYGYAWRVAGYVGAVIAINAGSPNAANDFETALERLQENVTGITCAVLSAWLFNPRGAAATFQASMARLSQGLEAVASRCAALLSAGGGSALTPEGALASLAGPLRAELGRFETLLQSAVNESHAVRANRAAWRDLAARCSSLVRSLPAWDHALAGLGPRPGALMADEPRRICNGLAAWFAAAGARLAGTAEAPGEGAPTEAGVLPESRLDQGLLDGLAPVERAELSLALTRLWHLGHIAEGQAALLGPPPADAPPTEEPSGHRSASPFEGFRPEAIRLPWTPDPVRLEVVVRLLLAIWIAVLLWFYLPEVPGGAGLVTLVAVFGLVDALAGIRIQMIAGTLALIYPLSGLIYVFVLPHLEGFSGLAILFFSMITFYCYLYPKPQQSGLRTLSMDFLFIVLGITNLQSYSFAGYLTRAATISIVFGILAFTQEVPWPSSPHRRLLRRLASYRSTLQALVAHLIAPRPRHPILRAWHHYRMAAALHSLTALSADIDRIPPAATELDQGGDGQRVLLLQQSLGALTHGLDTLVRLYRSDRIHPDLFMVQHGAAPGAAAATPPEAATDTGDGGPSSGQASLPPAMEEFLRGVEHRAARALSEGEAPTLYHGRDDGLYALIGTCRMLRAALRSSDPHLRAISRAASTRWGAVSPSSLLGRS